MSSTYLARTAVVALAARLGEARTVASVSLNAVQADYLAYVIADHDTRGGAIDFSRLMFACTDCGSVGATVGDRESRDASVAALDLTCCDFATTITFTTSRPSL